MKFTKLAHVGLRIRELRRHRRKSQHDLAAMLRAFNIPISRCMLANWETGRTDMSAHFIPFLAYALEADVTDLLPSLNRQQVTELLHGRLAVEPQNSANKNSRPNALLPATVIS